MMAIAGLITMIAAPFNLKAQSYDTSQVYSVHLLDGSVFVGKITDHADSVVIWSESLGRISVASDFVQTVEAYGIKLETPTDTRYQFNHAGPNRNFFTETAIGVEKGEWQYLNMMLFGNIFTYGLSDHFSLGLGIETLSMFNDNSPFFLVAPKVILTKPEHSIRFGFGSNIILNSDEVADGFGGTVYSLVTFGSRDNNFTVGVGYAFSQYEWFEPPIMQLGGSLRVSDNLGFVADFLVSTSSFEPFETFGSINIRFIFKRFNIDAGVLTGDNEGFFPALSFTYRLTN